MTSQIDTLREFHSMVTDAVKRAKKADRHRAWRRRNPWYLQMYYRHRPTRQGEFEQSMELRDPWWFDDLPRAEAPQPVLTTLLKEFLRQPRIKWRCHLPPHRVSTSFSPISRRRTRTILERRYLSDDPDTLVTLGDRFGLDKERIRQLEQTGLRTFRRWLRNKEIVNA